MATDDDIELRLKTTAEGDGAEKTSEKIKEVVDETKQATDATGELTKATDKLTEARKKAEARPAPRTLQEALDRGKADLEASIEAAEELARVTPEAVEVTNQQTEALTQQAEAAGQAAVEVKKLSEEEKKRQEQQRRDDVDVAKQRMADRKGGSGLNTPLAEGNESMAARAAGAAAVVTTAKVALDAVRETIRDYQKLRAEVGGAMTDQEIFFNSLADTIDIISNPLDALKNGLKGLAGLDNLENSIKQAAEMKLLYEGMVEARKRLYDQTREAAFESAMQRQRQEIDNTTASLRRQIEVLESRRKLTEAKADQSDQRALAQGVDPNVVAANKVARDAALEVERGAESVQESRNALESAKAKQQMAEVELSKVTQDNGSVDAINAARAAVEERGNAVTQASEDLKAALEKQQLLAETITTRANTDIDRLAGESDSKIRETVNSAIKVIEAASAEQGGKLSNLAQESLNSLYAVVSNGIPDSQDVVKIEQALNNFRNSNERFTQASQSFFGQASAGFEEAVNKMERFSQSLEDVRRRLASIPQ